jgi:hypothetical protein
MVEGYSGRYQDVLDQFVPGTDEAPESFGAVRALLHPGVPGAECASQTVDWPSRLRSVEGFLRHAYAEIAVTVLSNSGAPLVGYAASQ